MRSLIAKALFVVSTFAFAGCAVENQPADSDGTQESQADLSKTAAKYVANWHFDSTATDVVKFYTTLNLGADYSYASTTTPTCAPGHMCPMYIIVDSGHWSVTSKGKLTLNSDKGDTKIYTSSISSDGTGMKLFTSAGHEYMIRDQRVGEACGGFVANAKQCEEGLVCFDNSGIPDKGGICMKPVAEGGGCGFRTQGAPCADGLVCIHTTGPLDALHCAKPSAEGQFCGGIAAIQCPAGYGCASDGTYPDAGGHCVVCPVIDCAAPPEGCHYESDTPVGLCAKSCGKLVCDGSTL